jgi:formylglycine-generating enzyme
LKSAAAIGLSLLGIAATAGGVVGVVRLAAREHTTPEHCGAGLVAVKARCCAPGQTVSGAHCVGEPASCPEAMHVAASRSGCVADARRAAFAGGHLSLGAGDWQTEGVAEERTLSVAAFSLDATEVTLEEWNHCVQAGACRSLDDTELGAPVTDVDAKEAERFCRFEGGRLPSSDEWLFAAAGAEERRFPWGSTGLVCRRAVFGVESGPCATGGGVEISGSRPDGKTPEGVLDLAGNVAEWTMERDGHAVARGGSYRSRAALELKSWAVETPPPRARYVGFRCAYGTERVAPR